MKEIKNKTGGFTLIELLIVVGIIAILAAAIIVAISPGDQLSRARDASVRAQMQAIATSAYSYVIDDDQGRQPANMAALDISAPTHPLGSTYTFKFNDGRVTIKEGVTCVNHDSVGCLAISY